MQSKGADHEKDSTKKPQDILLASLGIDQLRERAASLPEPAPLVGPFKRGNLIMLYAPAGVGKTQVAVELAVTAACGGVAFGRWSAPGGAHVLYLDAEMGCRAMGIDRFPQALARARPLDDPDRLRIVTYDLLLDAGFGVPNLGEVGGLQALDMLVATADLIVLDNLSSLMQTGAENDAESWSLLNTWLLRQRAARRAVLVVHHAGKAGHQRGTSRRSDALDFVVKLNRPADYNASEGARFNLEFEKNRGAWGEQVEPFEAWLRPDPNHPDRLTWCCSESSDDTLMNRIVRAYRAGARGPSAIAEIVGSNKGTVSRYLARAKEQNLMGTTLDE